MKNNHPFHMVTLSPWPILMSLCLMNFLINMIMWMNLLSNSLFFLSLNLINMVIIMYQWMRDIIRESMFQGFHTFIIMNFLKFSMILFIISELFFFISFFWTYFHSSLSSTIEIGLLWPPKMILQINPYKIPLINSLILITSSFYVTISHYYLLNNKNENCMFMLIYTIILGLYFSILQLFEYYQSSFCMNDSIYGSIFYLATGFHGLHVLIGTLMLVFSLIRLLNFHFSMIHHLNFEFSIWYWHFVDMIWLFLYISIYWLMWN